mgnify:FL=1
MTKERYSELLKHPKWKEKRMRILDRDGKRCRKCNSTKNLQVHHTYYSGDKNPWDYPDSCLITLCKKCHEKEHEDKPIYKFLKIPKKKFKKIKKNIASKKKKNKNFKIEGRDKLLQEKYNKLKLEGKLPK